MIGSNYSIHAIFNAACLNLKMFIHKHISLYLCCSVVICFVLYSVFVCKCVLPPGDNPTAVSKYIISLLAVLDDWLTVHCSITLVDLQLDAQNSYLFIEGEHKNTP
jgi:hypothetical protein